jgi:hypothetical protein
MLKKERVEAPLVQGRRLHACPITGTPLTSRAEIVALPHLIHNVLAHLPQLAPKHALIPRYFPGAANMPVPLPDTLTMDEVNSLMMVDTHREWRAEPTLAVASASTAPLLAIKTSPGLSAFLSMEANPMVAIRARLRANRLPTQQHRYRLGEVDDPTCTYAACRISLPAPLDNAHHIFIHCPRHQAARQTLVHQLQATLHHTTPLTLAFVSGEVTEHIKPTRAQRARASVSLALTANFIHQLMADRRNDSTLKPFALGRPVILRPDPQRAL